MKDIRSHPAFNHIIIFIGILCIAWSAIFVKLADISGLGSAFYRLFIGTIGIIPLLVIRRKPINDWHSVKIAVICGIFFATDIGLWNTSIMLSKASVATLLGNIAPVWVGLGAIFFLKEKPKLIFWIGTITAIFGVILVVGIGNIYNATITTGNMLAITASFFYAAYLLTTRKGRSNLDTVSFTAISMGTSSLVLFIVCLLSDTQLTGFSAHSWLSLAGMGLISQLGGWLAINFALGHIKPTVASVTLLSQSVFTALISIPVLGEYMNGVEIAGGIIVLFGIYLVNKRMFRPVAEDLEL